MTLPPTSGMDDYGLEYPVEVDPLYFCWLWQDRRSRDGYGLIHKPKTQLAHCYVYEREIGPIPDGKVLDHFCRRRLCVNPLHLWPVTQGVNESRKHWRNRVKITHCQYGHRLYEHGRKTPEGGFACRVCQ